MRIFVAIFLISLFCACGSNTMFERVDAQRTGIDFVNLVSDNDTVNILDVENIYNGAGVGIGDFNGDGLQDIFFAANTESCRLYLNKGDFRFEDITEKSGANGEGKWIRGVTIVDINNDGKTDVYLNATLLADSTKRMNILYINKGNTEGVPVFENMADAYGLDDASHSTMSAFFDYDRDGDLDMYLLVNEILKEQFPNTFRPEIRDGSHPSTDKLFRNDWSDSLGHPVFVNISAAAGIRYEGYGHGVNITDINQDGWPDVLVTNDFLSNNILYINQRNGTFKNEIRSYFKHMAENAMGLDVVDINNDGLDDVIELDMNPEDNFRKKMMLNPLNYSRYINNDQFNYHYQYVRNMLHLNRGMHTVDSNALPQPIFSEIGFLAGIAETDWSWAPLVTDFDNDGFRDMIVTNGFPKDVTDHDFIAYRHKANMLTTKRELLDMLPVVKISNYAFRNQGNLSFSNKTVEWGMDLPSFSSSAAYADFDNDGDMDVVISNINDKPLLYRNRTEKTKQEAHYLNVRLQGDKQNRNAIGAQIQIWYTGGKQSYNYTPYRGYLATYQMIAHFGLGKASTIDSIRVIWPDGTTQLEKNIAADQEKVIIKSETAGAHDFAKPRLPSLFTDITWQSGLRYGHKEFDFVDFNIQRLLPHKLSEYGPAIAAGDINGDGLEDMVVGGSYAYLAQVFEQGADGNFKQRNLYGDRDSIPSKIQEDQGLLLFDADADKDLDLYIVSGGYEAAGNSPSYQDRLYLNDGKGVFALDEAALPRSLVSKSCVKAADIDRDGDLDLFVSGRVEPGKYPTPVQSFIFRNDTKSGSVKFTDVTKEIATDLMGIGMISDGIFSDFNNDNWPDLILAGEWMPIVVMQNDKGRFKKADASSGLSSAIGWWNSIAAGDVDSDGDMDYIAGNLGLNAFYRASPENPVFITGGDFDGNGRFDAIPSLFLPTSAEDRTRKEFPASLRDDLIEGIPGMKKRFPDYGSYARSNMTDLIPEKQQKGSIKLKANFMKTALLKNEGNGKFSVIELPVEAQFSVVYGMVLEDFNGDGHLDLFINGNDFGTEIGLGRYDASHGLVLSGKGDGGFRAMGINEGGMYIPGNGKAAVIFRNPNGVPLIAATENRGPLRLFQGSKKVNWFTAEADDELVTLWLKNGKSQKRELSWGSSFFSQSGRAIMIPESANQIEVRKSSGAVRKINY